MSSIFDAITLAPMWSGKPQQVDSIESQQPSELTSRLAIKVEQAKLSLKDKINARRLALAYKSQGIETLLDMTPLDQGEFIIFCRKQSMLETKIAIVRQFRSPEEALEAMILATVKGYCRTCYEECRKCICREIDKDWV